MSINLSAAKERYHNARWQAIREDWLARLTGKPQNLLPYEAVAGVLKTFEHRQLTELRSIPLNTIVGSVGRYRDFTRSFLPRTSIARTRWIRIDMAMNSLVGVPPIEVYQIGDVYFVSDGNHRVSVARANEFKEIDAYVTIIPGIADIQPGDTLDAAIVKVECSHFLAQTRLAERCEDLDIQVTQTGGYPRLLEHIYTHLYFMQLQRAERGQSQEEPIRFPDAARDWYDTVYLPIIVAVRANGLAARFPGRTATDLYVWISGRILELSEQNGQSITPNDAVRELGEQAPTPFYRAVKNLIDRLSEFTRPFSPSRLGRNETNHPDTPFE